MRLPRLSVLMLSLASAVVLVAACSGGDDEATATSTVGAATEVASSTSTAEANATASSTSTAESTSTSEATSTSTVEATSSSTSEATSTSTSEATSTASAESGDNDYETEIEDFAFEQGIAVPAGTTVRWKNRDGVPHTVTADDSSFDSGLLETNDTFEVVFDAAGAFTLHCNVHPTMTATITVQ